MVLANCYWRMRAGGVFDVVCYEGFRGGTRVKYVESKVGWRVDPIRLNAQCFFGTGVV